MHELRSWFIINNWGELKMFWYDNVFLRAENRVATIANTVSGSELSDWQEASDSAVSDRFKKRNVFLRAANRVATIANTVSRSELSDLQEESDSAVSDRFEKIESIWHLLFHVDIFNLVVIYFSPHICIFCSVVVGVSLYFMFVRCILYFI